MKKCVKLVISKNWLQTFRKNLLPPPAG